MDDHLRLALQRLGNPYAKLSVFSDEELECADLVPNNQQTEERRPIMTTSILSSDILIDAVKSNAAAFRCRRRLQPGGGVGDKVFPPTYSGAVYAIEQRRVAGCDQPVTCVF